MDVIDSIARYLYRQEKGMGVKGWESFLFGQRKVKRRYLLAALHPIKFAGRKVKEDEGLSLSTNRLLFWFVFILTAIFIAAVETMSLLGASVEVCQSGVPPASRVLT